MATRLVNIFYENKEMSLNLNFYFTHLQILSNEIRALENMKCDLKFL